MRPYLERCKLRTLHMNRLVHLLVWARKKQSVTVICMDPYYSKDTTNLAHELFAGKNQFIINHPPRCFFEKWRIRMYVHSSLMFDCLIMTAAAQSGTVVEIPRCYRLSYCYWVHVWHLKVFIFALSKLFRGWMALSWKYLFSSDV